MRSLCTSWLAASLAVFFVVSVGCSSSGSGSGGGGGGGGTDTTGGSGTTGAKASTKANAADIQVKTSGSGAVPAGGSFKGEADAAAANQWGATVANGELSLYFAAAGTDASVLYLKVNMTKADIPGTVTAKADLGGDVYLSLTSAIQGVYEADGNGSVTIDTCPDKVGAVITGSWNNTGMAVKASATGATNITLDGTFKATVAATDGSHKCKAAPVTQPDAGSTATDATSGGKKGPPGCANETCDGPCCPYLTCIATCLLDCTQKTCMDPSKMAECIACEPNCMTSCNVSGTCKTAYEALGACSGKNQCSGDMDNDPCIGQNCCTEYKAVF